MSEPQPPEPTPEQGTPQVDRLRRQAEDLRRTTAGASTPASQYRPWQKVVILAVMLATLGGSLILALSSQLRLRVLNRIGQEWVRLYQSDRQAGIHKLPAPPPRRVDPQVLGGAPVIITAADDGVFVPGETTERETEKTFVPPSKNAQFEAAFRILTERNPAASALAGGQMEGLQFQEWRALQARPPVFYVDLIAIDAAGKEGHYIWSVNLEDNQIAAQSQLARDLANR